MKSRSPKLNFSFAIVFTLLASNFAHGAEAKISRSPALLEGQIPVFFIKDSQDHDEMIKTLNLFNSATLYGFVTNKIRNGSGNDTNPARALASQGSAEQALRSLSLFDLYFTHAVLTSGLKTDFAFSVLPMTLPQSNLFDPFQLKIVHKYLTSWAGLITPILETLIRKEPTKVIEESTDKTKKDQTARDNSAKTYNEYTIQGRSGIALGLSLRYPGLTRPMPIPGLKASESTETIAKLDWMARSYQPLYFSGWFKTTGKDNFFKTTTLFPAFGLAETPLKTEKGKEKEPDFKKWTINPIDLPQNVIAEPAKITRVTYGAPGYFNNGVVRLRTSKTFSINGKTNYDKMNFDITFGRVAPQGTKDLNIGAMVEDKQDASSLTRDDSVIAHGHIAFPGKDLKNNFLEDALGGGLRLEISIHKMAFEFSRFPKEGEQAYQNIASVFSTDPGYSLNGGIRMIPESSLVSFRVWLDRSKFKDVGISKPGFLNNLKQMSWGKSAKDLRYFAMAFLCGTAMDRGGTAAVMNSSQPCLVEFKSYKDFQHTFSENWVASYIAKTVSTNVANSVAGNIAQAGNSKNVDMGGALTKITMDVWDQFQKARNDVQNQLPAACAEGFITGKLTGACPMIGL